MNYMLIMKNGQSALVAIGPVAIEYQAAMLRDEIENSSDWTGLGIARASPRHRPVPSSTHRSSDTPPRASS